MHEDDTSESLFVCAKIPVSSGPLKETITVRGGFEMGRCMERRGEKEGVVWSKNAFNVHRRWLEEGCFVLFPFF